tara:strand:- start:2107 stop:2766 length:660 start_codon:yes stop_codon:yes gene_type:complete
MNIMPFKSRDQFFYLLYNQPKVWKEWITTYGVPKKFKLGGIKSWEKKINEIKSAESEESLSDIITIQNEIMELKYELDSIEDAPTKAVISGAIVALEGVIHGLEKIGVTATIEEVSERLLPSAVNNIEVLEESEIFNHTYYYNAGKAYGYSNALDHINPFPILWQYDLSAEDEEEVTLSKKEVKTNIWYPLIVGFTVGTLSTIIGNLHSVMWLKSKGHI